MPIAKNIVPIYATDINGIGVDAFLQYVEHNSNGDWKGISAFKVFRIDFLAPYFVIWVFDEG